MIKYPKDIPCVYIVESTSGHYKIGYSTNTEARLKQLTGTQGPFQYSLMLSIPFETKSDALRCEKDFHKRFASKRFRGEWFSLSKIDLLRIRVYEKRFFREYFGKRIIKR